MLLGGLNVIPSRLLVPYVFDDVKWHANRAKLIRSVFSRDEMLTEAAEGIKNRGNYTDTIYTYHYLYKKSS